MTESKKQWMEEKGIRGEHLPLSISSEEDLSKHYNKKRKRDNICGKGYVWLRKDYENLHTSLRKEARRVMILAYVDIKGKEVHHKDGNPFNNSRSNLIVLDKNKHKHGRIKNKRGFVEEWIRETDKIIS